MKMLTGLLPPTEGNAVCLSAPVDNKNIAARQQVGYMSLAFSLYGELTAVLQKSDITCPVVPSAGRQNQRTGNDTADPFRLEPYLDDPADALPLGIRQRLSLAW